MFGLDPLQLFFLIWDECTTIRLHRLERNWHSMDGVQSVEPGLHNYDSIFASQSALCAMWDGRWTQVSSFAA